MYRNYIYSIIFRKNEGELHGQYKLGVNDVEVVNGDAMHVWAQKGSIENGKDADLVLLDEHVDVKHVFVKGKRVR